MRLLAADHHSAAQQSDCKHTYEWACSFTHMHIHQVGDCEMKAATNYKMLQPLLALLLLPAMQLLYSLRSWASCSCWLLPHCSSSRMLSLSVVIAHTHTHTHMHSNTVICVQVYMRLLLFAAPTFNQQWRKCNFLCNYFYFSFYISCHYISYPFCVHYV